MSEQVLLKTPKSTKTKLKVSSKPKSSGMTTEGEGEMELKSPFASPTKKKSSKRRSSLNEGEGDSRPLDDSPKTPSTSKEKLNLKSPKTPKTPKTPGRRKSTKLMPEAPLSAPARSRSKSPGRLKSKRQSSTAANNNNGGSTKDRPNWWNLNDADLLFLNTESDDEGQQKLTPEEIQRRNEQVMKFRDKYAEELRGSVVPQGLVSKLLEQAKQKERESKPIVLPNVRAQPLKIDVSKFEAPSYKKDVEQKTLLKETAKKNFILKDFVNTGAKPDIRKLVKAFESVEVENGRNIVNQGDQGDHYFVVESGEVEFQIDHVTVRTAGAGSTFGDRNLLYQAPWNETVKASGANPIKLLRLHHNTYRGIMQTTEEAKKPPPPPPPVRKQQEDENAWLVNSKAIKEMAAIKAALKKKTADDLERIKVLGEGQFGEVWLVATDLPGVAVPKGKTQHEFALKIQNKGGDEKMIANIRGEIKVMEELSHPFVSCMYTTYENEDSIDMLLGLIPGGELWDLVHKENEETGEWLSGIPETHAQFYSMVVADTLSYMHTQGFIFRDLKMENIMIDAKGYPIIVDFGFSKKCEHKTYTFCGTPNYVAPEIIKNLGHGAPVDWWALGVVLYEMISGENPFYYDGLEQMELYQAICDDKPEPLKEGFSKSIVNLIDKLLVKDPEKRLGSGKKKGKEVLNHAFFTGLNLKRLRLKKIKAPWIPGEDQEANKKEYEAELERERLADKEEEARLQAESKRHEEQEAAIRKAEEEARLYAEQQEQKRLEQQELLRQEAKEREQEEQRRLQQLRAQEEERKRLEAEEQRVAEEKWRQRRLREEEEERRREEEEEELRRQKEEEEAEQERLRSQEEEMERQRHEEELRLQKEEERLRLKEEEAERQRQEEEAEHERLQLEEEEQAEQLRRQKEEEEAEQERLRLEEEEAERELRQEDLRRQKEEEEAAQQERLRLEAAEKKRKLEKKRMEKERRQREEEEDRKRLEAEEKEKVKARRREERRKQKELEKQQEIELEMELKRQKEEAFAEVTGELSLDDVFQPQRIENLEGNWNDAVQTPKGTRRRISDMSPVPNGLVKKVVTSGLETTSPKNLYSPRVQDELNKSIGKGLVAKRLAKAKEKQMGGSVPSMFSGFSL